MNQNVMKDQIFQNVLNKCYNILKVPYVLFLNRNKYTEKVFFLNILKNNFHKIFVFKRKLAEKSDFVQNTSQIFQVGNFHIRLLIVIPIIKQYLNFLRHCKTYDKTMVKHFISIKSCRFNFFEKMFDISKNMPFAVLTV